MIPGGLEIAPLFLLLLPLILISAWFWIRLAAVGEVDFNPTPAGTSFFLLSHVTPKGLRPASIFMSFVCIWLVSTPFLGVLYHFIPKVRRLERIAMLLLFLTPNASAMIFYALMAYAFSYTFGYVGARVAKWLHKYDAFMRWVKRPAFEEYIKQWCE